MSRATHAKRLLMMVVMMAAMLLRDRVPERMLIAAVAIAVVVIVALYALVVSQILRRDGARKGAIARAIIAGMLPIGARLFLARSTP